MYRIDYNNRTIAVINETTNTLIANNFCRYINFILSYQQPAVSDLPQESGRSVHGRNEQKLFRQCTRDKRPNFLGNAKTAKSTISTVRAQHP